MAATHMAVLLCYQPSAAESQSCTFSETSRETTTDFLRDNFYSKPVSSMDKPTTSRHYGSWTLKELKLELMARKAKRTGKKADLVKR